MDAFIARQPIFNAHRQVAGYELLYRDGDSGNRAVFTDGDQATCRLLSDAITLFGLSELTNHKLAYVNFTQNLILNDFVLLAKPSEVVVELLESVQPTAEILSKLEQLKEQGYTIALDDYTGDRAQDPMIPFVDILKVDFRLTTAEQRAEIVQRHKKRRGLKLLAEKVETQEEYALAAKQGYHLFQGYFFQKPIVLEKKILSLSTSSYGRFLRELQKKEIDFAACAKIIHADPVLTYRIMQKVQTLRYYRGNIVTVLRQALVIMGTTELRRWIILLLARENNVTGCDELVRKSYLRGIFAERLLAYTEADGALENAFLLGMFSLLDKILGMSMEELVREVKLPESVRKALLDQEENLYTRLLEYIHIYELGNPNLLLPDIGLTVGDREISHIYMECLIEVDKAFNEVGEERSPCQRKKR